MRKVSTQTDGQDPILAATDHQMILYVEDNAANLRLVSQLVSRFSKVKLLSAHNAEIGIELALEHQPDLILLDINLPGMNGFEALEILRERLTNKKTPIVAISANAMPNEIQKALNADFDSYITKPVDVGHLMVEIDRLLER